MNQISFFSVVSSFTAMPLKQNTAAPAEIFLKCRNRTKGLSSSGIDIKAMGIIHALPPNLLTCIKKQIVPFVFPRFRFVFSCGIEHAVECGFPVLGRRKAGCQKRFPVVGGSFQGSYDSSIMPADQCMNHFPAVAFPFLPRFFLQESSGEFIPVLAERMFEFLLVFVFDCVVFMHDFPYRMNCARRFTCFIRNPELFGFSHVCPVATDQHLCNKCWIQFIRNGGRMGRTLPIHSSITILI